MFAELFHPLACLCPLPDHLRLRLLAWAFSAPDLLEIGPTRT
jgi:hypothetical protein